MPNSYPTWRSNAVVCLMRMEDRWISKPFFISFTVSAEDFLNRQQNFIALLCSFFKSIFKSSDLRWVTKTTSTKIVVTRQWNVIIGRNFALLLGCALQWVVLSSEASSHLFLVNLCRTTPTKMLEMFLDVPPLRMMDGGGCSINGSIPIGNNLI